jgi:TetR/AcrR family transcriptional repressor of nem operon
MNAKVERRQRSHATILESAARLVRQKGICGARVADVMEGAALTVGGFYAHFSSKDEMVDETIRRTGAELRDRLFARLDEKPEGDRVEVILRRYLAAAHRDASALGCPLPAVVGEVGTTAPQHRDVLAEQVEAMTARLEEHLPGGRVTSPRPLAIGLVALMYGGLSLARALRGTELSDEVLRACRMLGATLARGGTKA